MNYIYGLFDPRDGELRYIGKSINPKQRLTNHLNDKSITWRTNWLKELKRLNLKPLLYIFESFKDNNLWQEKEIYYIAIAKNRGIKLTNCTSGGDGLLNPPKEVLDKIRNTWKGRKHTEETKKLIGSKHKGKKHTEEHKRKISKIMKGRKITWIKKVRDANQKLNRTQIIKIRKMLTDGISQYVIADKFNVHQGTISNIKNGKVYLHIKNA